MNHIFYDEMKNKQGQVRDTQGSSWALLGPQSLFKHRFGYCAVKKNIFTMFREVFRSFREVFRSFREFFEAFGSVRTHSDPFGPIGMHSDAFGTIWKHLDVFEKFVNVSGRNL